MTFVYLVTSIKCEEACLKWVKKSLTNPLAVLLAVTLYGNLLILLNRHNFSSSMGLKNLERLVTKSMQCVAC